LLWSKLDTATHWKEHTVKLTPAQTRALAAVKAAGRVYAYNGVTVATARALARLGLVTFHSHGVHVTTNYRTKRTRYTADWSITPSV
jgi:hypothetical protein